MERSEGTQTLQNRKKILRDRYRTVPEDLFVGKPVLDCPAEESRRDCAGQTPHIFEAVTRYSHRLWLDRASSPVRDGS